jgi:uncharacterized damage-inducible protein DinB
MKPIPDRIGRPRRYDLAPVPGFAQRELALQAAWLRELAERVYDQIADLPLEALDYAPGETKLSIARLVVHLAWAEANWVANLTKEPWPESLNSSLELGKLGEFSKPPVSMGTAAELIAFCRRVQESFTFPALAKVIDIDTPFEAGGRTVNVRGVVTQLQWHWTYHSGQIGLVRLQWGSDYQWTNEAIVGRPPA